MVAERALTGDLAALKIYNDVGKYLGQAISFVANLMNPEKIIIGGGVASAGSILLNPVLESFNEYIMEVIKSNTGVLLSSLGIDAGVYGAISLALNDVIFSGVQELLG